jgi:PhnB protein
MAKARVPEGYHTVTPHLILRDAARAIEFYKRAFGAEERMRLAMPDRTIVHAELKIGDSIVMLSDEFPQMDARSPHSLGGTASGIMIYCENVDSAFRRAVDAGATVKMPVADMFWGDRYGKLEDPFGHQWALASRIEDLTVEEVRKRAQAAFAQPPKP